MAQACMITQAGYEKVLSAFDRSHVEKYNTLERNAQNTQKELKAMKADNLTNGNSLALENEYKALQTELIAYRDGLLKLVCQV
jgi:hypothetical protein